jgi:hypothetical protein
VNLQPIERPAVIERPSTRRQFAVSSRLIARRAKRNPKILVLPGLIALAAVISTVAVLEATRVGDEPVASLASASETVQSVESQVRESATDIEKDEARLVPDAPDAADADPETVSPIQTASIGRPADPAIAAVAASEVGRPLPAATTEQAVEPMPTPAAVAPETTPDAAALAEVAVAESEDDVLALEASLIEEGSSGAFEVASTPTGISDETTASIPSGMSEARVNAFVNLRAAPTNDGQVIRVVPANATVQAQADCRHFCEVVHEGTRGYIYKSFLTR